MKDVFILFIMCSAWVGWGTSDVAITQDEEFITLWYNSSNTHIATFKINFNLPRGMTCDEGTVWYMCVTDDNYWGPHCNHWGAVGWNTGDTDWGYKPEAILQKKDKDGKPLLNRLTLLKSLCANEKKVKLVVTIENPSANDTGTYVIGGYGGMASGYKAGIKLKDMLHSPEWRTEEKYITDIVHLVKTHVQMYNEMVAISDPTIEEVYAVETGYSDTNYWLEWMKYTATQYNQSNCYVCASARPHLGSVPLHLDPASEQCFLSLFTNSTTNNPICETWKAKYPIITQAPTRSQGITIYPGNYTCFLSEGEGRDLGKFGPGYCGSYSNATRDQLLNQVQSVADVFWICGDMKIRPKLEGNWTGECALAKALMPLHVIPLEDGKTIEVFSHSRTARSLDPYIRYKRTAELTPKGSFDPHIYIDVIGVPRGVPAEFKARDQVKAGVESIFPQITINKNVDWINYIYYNQQRFVNYTRDALHGLVEQLGPTSIMTFQNRMALDMVLAEKGGVCKMIKDVCCTYIPDNTGPKGKVTLAIKKLDNLSEELKRNAGITDPWDQYFSWMSGWQKWLAQVGMVLGVVLLVSLIVVICVIPCVKKMLCKGLDEATPAFVCLEEDNYTYMEEDTPEEAVPMKLITEQPKAVSMRIITEQPRA